MSDWRITPQNTALVVVDPQERLMAVMDRRADTLAAIKQLAVAAAILGIGLRTLQRTLKEYKMAAAEDEGGDDGGDDGGD